jgi:hypothetical protein
VATPARMGVFLIYCSPPCGAVVMAQHVVSIPDVGFAVYVSPVGQCHSNGLPGRQI